ncbi:WYL domain-containing transcriptional regulator [Desulfotomaculum defluvii]
MSGVEDYSDEVVTKNFRLNFIVDYINKQTPYGGVTIKELMNKFGVSDSQIHRDLNTIGEKMGYSLLIKKVKIKRHWVSHYYFDKVHLPSISPEKATVIFLSLLQQKGSALTGYINEIKDILVTSLFKNRFTLEEQGIETLQKRIYMVEEALTEPDKVGDIFAKIIPALKKCYRLKISYFGAYRQGVTEREVEPYGLVCKRQNWYLIAFCLLRNKLRVFRVDQIQNIFPLSMCKFQYPKDFDLNEYMANSWGVINDNQIYDVKLKFHPSMSFRVKNYIYHSSQILDELPDGSVLISMRVCGLDELKTWIIQWGKTVEILEPKSLREEICKFCKDIIKLYD